jgi:sulfotransferase
MEYIMENIVFVSGLPRSGSTLLTNFLGQNKNHYATPTSGLIELVLTQKRNWRNFIEFKAEGLDVVQPRVIKSIKGMMHGYFEDELKENKIIFDKSRGWIAYIEMLEEILERPVKIIVTVRDIRAIVASFEKIYRKRSIDYIEPDGPAYFKCQTAYGRADEILREASVVGLTVNRLRDALQRGMGDRLLIIPYQDFMTRPKDVMDKLHEKLGLEKFDYNPDHVEQVTHENDVWHGMKLHTIRNKIEPPESVPWENVLPKDLCENLRTNYGDINDLCQQGILR